MKTAVGSSLGISGTSFKLFVDDRRDWDDRLEDDDEDTECVRCLLSAAVKAASVDFTLSVSEPPLPSLAVLSTDSEPLTMTSAAAPFPSSFLVESPFSLSEVSLLLLLLLDVELDASL